MKRSGRHVLIGVLMIGAGNTVAADAPHIGYAYPAGGQQGTTVDVLLGGQFMDGATNVFVSGEGVKAEILQYSVKYEQRELRQLYRRKDDLLATIKERQDKGEPFAKEERQLQEVSHRLSLADLPEGVDWSDQRKAMRSYVQDSKEQFNPQIAERLGLRISIDRQARSGERQLRIATPSGLSNPHFFEVGTLAEVQEEEPNDDHMSPSLVSAPAPCVINGQIRPGDIDHFRFQAGKGASIVVNVAARRIIPYLADAVPGWFQAVVALYDEDGNEVAYEDDYKFDPDPVLFFDVPETGTYTLSIRDSIYRGREDFIYRIAVGELPFITSIFPLGGQQGQTVDIALGGRNLPRMRISGGLPDNDGTIRQVSVVKDGYRSNQMPFAIDTLPEAFEVEPNDSCETAQAAPLPLILNGRIQQAGDRDLFHFQGEKGDTVSIGITARPLNSPLDSILSLSGPGLAAPVRNDDFMAMDPGFLHLGSGLVTHQADSYLLQELPETGTYYVEVADTQRKGGHDHAYRLRMSLAQPDFDLRMEPSGLQIAPGGTAAFTVRALRKEGFDGSITLNAGNLPSGFRVGETLIPAGSAATRITITAPNEMASEVVSPEIIGTAMIDGSKVSHTAVPVDDQMQAFLYRHLVPSTELVLAPVATPSAITFEAQLPKSGIIELPLGKEVRIFLKGYLHIPQQGVKVELDHAPAGLSTIQGWIGRGKNIKADGNDAVAGSVLLKAEAPLKPGERLSLVLVAVMKKGKEEARFPAPSIPVQIVESRSAQ